MGRAERVKKRQAEALIEVVLSNDLSALKSLLDGGADVNLTDVNAQDRAGETALMKAAFNGHVSIVEMLLAGNADLELKNNDGETALTLAESIGQIRVVELLEGAASSINMTTS